jgi:hypothetical protein
MGSSSGHSLSVSSWNSSCFPISSGPGVEFDSGLKHSLLAGLQPDRLRCGFAVDDESTDRATTKKERKIRHTINEFAGAMERMQLIRRREMSACGVCRLAVERAARVKVPVLRPTPVAGVGLQHTSCRQLRAPQHARTCETMRICDSNVVPMRRCAR